MPEESKPIKLDETQSPESVESILTVLAGFDDALGIAFRLDTGKREIEISGQLITQMTNAHVEGRQDDQFMRGYPILARAKLPDVLWQTELFHKLNKPTTYGRRGARCFMPGLALRLTTQCDSLDLLFCLSCRYLNAFHSDEPVFIPLSFSGSSYFHSIYFSLFPDQRRNAHT